MEDSLRGQMKQFSHSPPPVSGLSFYAVGSDDVGNTALVDVFAFDFIVTLPISTNGIFNIPNFVDLSAFSGVHSIRLYNITDGGGLGWDNFTFTPRVPDGGSTVSLLGCALLGLAALRRKLS
jgi:protein with PEP-CTERM/exosortase system signal